MAFNDNNPTDDWDNFGASQDAPNADQGDDWDNWDATDSQSDIPQDVEMMTGLTSEMKVKNSQNRKMVGMVGMKDNLSRIFLKMEVL